MTNEPASWEAAVEDSREKQPAPAAPAVRSPPVPAAPAAERLTRTAVARRLGCSVSKVRTLEGKVLHPVVADGVHTFAAAEVEALAAAPPPRRAPARPGDAGAVAGAVFRLFDAGKNLRQVVVELGGEPEKVRALYSEWRTPDLEEGERQRLRRARAAEEERELERFSRLADKQAREHEKQISEITKAMLAYAPKK